MPHQAAVAVAAAAAVNFLEWQPASLARLGRLQCRDIPSLPGKRTQGLIHPALQVSCFSPGEPDCHQRRERSETRRLFWRMKQGRYKLQRREPEQSCRTDDFHGISFRKGEWLQWVGYFSCVTLFSPARLAINVSP